MMKLQNKLAGKLLEDMDKQHEVLKEENKRKLESWYDHVHHVFIEQSDL